MWFIDFGALNEMSNTSENIRIFTEKKPFDSKFRVFGTNFELLHFEWKQKKKKKFS